MIRRKGNCSAIEPKPRTRLSAIKSLRLSPVFVFHIFCALMSIFFSEGRMQFLPPLFVFISLIFPLFPFRRKDPSNSLMREEDAAWVRYATYVFLLLLLLLPISSPLRSATKREASAYRHEMSQTFGATLCRHQWREGGAFAAAVLYRALFSSSSPPSYIHFCVTD